MRCVDVRATGEKMPSEFDHRTSGSYICRRTFLQGAAGLVGVTILGAPLYAVAQDETPASAAVPTPGVATQRIEGRAKVTGQKIFARDYNARDLPGWGQDQWYAMYLCALTTDHVFQGVNLAALPPDAQPKRIVLGDQLHASQRSPRLTRSRDLMVESIAREEVADANLSAALTQRAGLDSVIEYDLIVKPGAKPDYLGQGVALLLFDTLASYRAARRFMQFRDAEFQVYDPATSPSEDKPYSPQTTYVKYFEDGESFSYAVADPKTYLQVQVPAYRQKIEKFISDHPEFLKRDISVDTQAMDPMFMEPEAGLVYYEASSSRLRLLLGTQSPDGDIADILSMYGTADSPIKVQEIELTSCFPGGGFGGRDSSPFSLLLALAAAFSDGQPVKLAHDRFEQFRLGLKRPGVKIRGQLVVGLDMKLQSITANLDFNGGGLKNLSPYVANLASLCMGGAYDIPTANIFGQSIHTQDIPGGSQRGFGGPEAFFALETAFDDIIAAKGWDAIAARRVNLAVPTTRTVIGGPIGQELRLGEMLDCTAAHPLWAEREAIKAQYAAKGLAYGTGLAMSLQAYGTSGDGMVGAVFIERDGTLKVQSDAVDMGNGSATTLSIVVGPILGRNADAIEMGCYRLFGETGLTTSDPDNQRWANAKWTPKSVGSSSACLTALHQVHVVQQAAYALFHGAVLPAARIIWGRPELKADDLVWRTGDLATKAGGLPPIPRAKLAGVIYSGGLPTGALGHAYFQAGWAEADYATQSGSVRLKLDGLSFYMPDATAPVMIGRQNTNGPGVESKRFSRYVWAPCINVVGLVVDKTTGDVRVENVLSVLNAGRLHVPQLVSGQSQGGVAMAIGYALLEDMPDGMAGPANGTWNLDRYHVPRWGDVPLLDTYTPGGRAQELIVLPQTPGDQGAGRGIAEAVMCSIAPAISNALRDATGRRFTSLPITPEKILKGLQQ
jgi:CO/xanthine dehydrogenase Mo-binding subunit